MSRYKVYRRTISTCINECKTLDELQRMMLTIATVPASEDTKRKWRHHFESRYDQLKAKTLVGPNGKPA